MRTLLRVSLLASLSLGAAMAPAASAMRGTGGAVADAGGGLMACANGADGGNRLSSGMPGCRGGTDPAPDGKFYIPGTQRRCNPGKQDRGKVGPDRKAAFPAGPSPASA